MRNIIQLPLSTEKKINKIKDLFCDNASIFTIDVLGQKSILHRNVKRKMNRMRMGGKKKKSKKQIFMLHYYTQLIYQP